MSKYIQLFKDDQMLLGSDGLMKIDGRLNIQSIINTVTNRNRTFEKNFPHKICNSFAIFSGRIGSNLTAKIKL